MADKITVGFNVAPTYGKSRGVRRYVDELSAQLRGDNRLDIVPIGPSSKPGSKRERVYALSKAGFVARQIDETLVAPLIQGRECDLLHYTDTYGPLASKRPYVVTVHDTTFLSHPDEHDRWVVQWLTTMSKITWRNAKLIISVSETTAADLESAGVPKSKIRVIPHGIDHALAQESKSSPEKPDWIDARYIAYLGNIEPRKGLPTLLAAFQQAQPELPSDVQLFIAGSEVWGPAFDQLSSYTDKMRFLGPLPESQLATYLENADLFVYPSKYEGFGLPPLEALSKGTRVIVGDTPAARETLDRYANYFDPGNVNQLAGVIVKLLYEAVSPVQRQSRIEYSRKFSWHAAANATVDIYREALTL